MSDDDIEARMRAFGQLMQGAPGPLPGGSYQSEYDIGREDEREAIAQWLRAKAVGLGTSRPNLSDYFWDELAAKVEAGEHLK